MSLKKTTWILAAAALLGSLPAAADNDVVVRRFLKQLPGAGVERVLVDVPVGEVIIDGGTGTQIQLEVRLECDERGDACEELARRVKVVFSREAGELTLRVKEWPKTSNKGLEAHVRVLVPHDLALEAHLGVGQLNIASLDGDVEAELGVGELNITLPAASVGSVSADTGIGAANLVASGRHYESAGLVAREIRWNKGTGKSRVEADCGVGEIDIKLTK
jgi:hypothetical protein